MQQLPDHFLPTLSQFSAMTYLDTNLFRFQGLIWRILDFCILLGSGDVAKTVKNVIFENLQFCKNKNLSKFVTISG